MPGGFSKGIAVLKFSIGLSLALTLLQATAPLMATGGDTEAKTERPDEVAAAVFAEPVTPAPTGLSISLRQALGDPGAVESIREVRSEDVDLSRVTSACCPAIPGASG